MRNDKPTLLRRGIVPDSVSKPLVTPIYPSVVYSSPSPDALDDQYEGRASGYTYAREGHPNAEVLAQNIDRLEGAHSGIVTGSGMAACGAAFLGLFKSGDHIIAGDQLYGRTLRLLAEDMPKFGINSTLADPTDAGAIENAIRPETKAILVEVVSNPTLRIADMPAIEKIAKRHGLLLIVDNTFTTPIAFQPFAHGADIVIHSVTKMLAGHSDVMLGYLAAADPNLQSAINTAVTTWGFTPSPYECWLAERGLYSLDLRFERAQENAQALADFLATQDLVEAVIYPGRPDHPDHNRARQILGANTGNMLSFRLKGGRNAANALTTAAPNLPFAPTLGDIGTILSHPATSSHRALTPKQRAGLGIDEGFFRVSVGIEKSSELISAFETAIRAAGNAGNQM